MRVWRPKTAYAARTDGDWTALKEEIAQVPDPDAWWQDFILSGRLRDLPTGWQEQVSDALNERRAELLVIRQSKSLDAGFRRAMERD
jgi:hypothetical protein